MKYTYHAPSWSKIARECTEIIYSQVIDAIENGYSKDEFSSYLGGGEFIYRTPEQWATHYFSNFDGNSLIANRAAKRYGRKMKKYRTRHK